MYPACVDTVAIRSAFDAVHERFMVGLYAWAESLGAEDSLQWRDSSSGTVTHFADAPFKDHLHVYYPHRETVLASSR